MSDEGASLIESVFIEKIGAKYPFVRASGVNQKYAIRFFPSVYCISPDGTILTTPQDRLPSESFIEEQLKNVTLSPRMPDDSRFDAVRGWWEKKEHARLADYFAKMLAQQDLDADLRTEFTAQQQELQKRLERQKARVAELGKGPDYGTAEAKLEKIAQEWKGLAPGDAAEAELKRFDKDPEIKKELGAAKTLQRLIDRADTSKASGRRKLIDDLEKFYKRYSGTGAAERARTMRGQMVEQGG